MKTPDVEALYETLDQITLANSVGAWIQAAWIATPEPDCGFAGCFAGWRAHLDGGVVIRETGGGTWMLLPDGTAIDRPDLWIVDERVRRDVTWMEWADERFGLEGTIYADSLTESTNDLDTIHALVDDIAVAALPSRSA